MIMIKMLRRKEEIDNVEKHIDQERERKSPITQKGPDHAEERMALGAMKAERKPQAVVCSTSKKEPTIQYVPSMGRNEGGNGIRWLFTIKEYILRLVVYLRQ